MATAMYAISEAALDTAARMYRQKVTGNGAGYDDLNLTEQAEWREPARAILWAALQVSHPFHTEECGPHCGAT